MAAAEAEACALLRTVAFFVSFFFVVTRNKICSSRSPVVLPDEVIPLYKGRDCIKRA
jgi:hypothetical protein